MPPDEAETVRRIFREYLSGKGIGSIANGLNADGVRTRYENAWSKGGGYFSFMSVAGLRSHLDACVPEAHITVPDGVEKYEEKFFCSTCRGLLETYAQCGFVLADLRNQETPTIYPVEDGTEFEVRCYTVVVSKTDEGELDIAVLGSIPTDE